MSDASYCVYLGIKREQDLPLRRLLLRRLLRVLLLRWILLLWVLLRRLFRWWIGLLVRRI